MKNTTIKKFDEQLAGIINSGLEAGIEISTIILALEKYLFNARAIENEILQRESLQNTKNSNNDSPVETIDESSTLDINTENGEIA